MMLYPGAGYPGEYFPILGVRDISVTEIVGTFSRVLELFGTAAFVMIIELLGTTGGPVTLDGSANRITELIGTESKLVELNGSAYRITELIGTVGEDDDGL